MNNNFIVTEIHRVIFVGKEEYRDEVCVFPGDLRYNELILHMSGSGTVDFNGKRMKISENTIRFLPKGENREYIVRTETEGECIDVFFDSDCPVSDEAFALNLKSNEKVNTLFKKIFSIWVAKNDGYYFECISLLYKIFAEMQKNDYIPESRYQTIQPAIKYIDENFISKKIAMPELAEMCGISSSYLQKLFIKRFSVSPGKYVIRLKINYACDLLLTGRYSVSQTAEFCGYENIHFFSRQFKEYTGVTPTEFKNKYKSSK